MKASLMVRLKDGEYVEIRIRAGAFTVRTREAYLINVTLTDVIRYEWQFEAPGSKAKGEVSR